MRHCHFSRKAACLLIWLVVAMQQASGADEASDETHTIFGFVMELRSGTPEVPVLLCDATTGMPVSRETYRPVPFGRELFEGLAVQVTDNKGNYRFENVPDGKYRLLAQKWTGPFKGFFEEHGTTTQLMGVADEVVVPRPTDAQAASVVLSPRGAEGVVMFDQQSPNSGTILFLSTAPTEFDPILGPYAMGTSFWQHLVGINRMPLGKTTVLGVPNQPLYAFLFAPDNSPGFASIEVPAPKGQLVRVPMEPFVAGWSDGRKTPPPKLAALIEFLEKHELSVGELLQIPPLANATFKAHRARMEELTRDLSREVQLADGQSARVGDLLAAEGYQRMIAAEKARVK